MGNELKVLGKIDLDEYNGLRKPVANEYDPFRIVAMTVSFWEQDPVVIDFSMKEDEGDYEYRYFSLLIGSNGIGKSTLLREIIDFFVYAKKGFEDYKSKQIVIYTIIYTLGGHTYKIMREGKEFSYYCDDVYAAKNELVFPLIIASTMGMFDKFPYQNNGRNNKVGPYDVSMYKYVGPRANSNMFSSKTYLMMQMLAALKTIKQKKQLTKIADVLKFIGYEKKLTLKIKVKNTNDPSLRKKRENLSDEGKEYLDDHLNIFEDELTIKFDKSTILYVKGLKLKEMNELRQNGLLTWSRCYLYRDGKEIECNQLSSGEFNMLGIVMSVVLTADNNNVLILLDEPEISQHPNWQIDIIDNLDKTLDGYNCHFLIATHCHFLVSNLPTGRSCVIDVEKDRDKRIMILPLQANTYGWSAEEVLLKAFKLATDRSRYLADVVGGLLTKIAKNEIAISQVEKEARFLELVSKNLKDVDPMKKVIDTIIKSFA